MRRCGLERLTSAHLRDFSAVRSFATPAPKPRKSGDPLCATLKTTLPTKNEQNNEREKANASAKSKELHPHAQNRPNAAHLLLPQPTQQTL